MTSCGVRERGKVYSASLKRTHRLEYGKRTAGSDAVLEYLKSLDIPRSQAYFWTPDWISSEKSADADITAGRVHVSNTADEIIQYLNSPDQPSC